MYCLVNSRSQNFCPQNWTKTTRSSGKSLNIPSLHWEYCFALVYYLHRPRPALIYRHAARPRPGGEFGGLAASKEELAVCYAAFSRPAEKGQPPRRAAALGSLHRVSPLHRPSSRWPCPFGQPSSRGCGRAFSACVGIRSRQHVNGQTIYSITSFFHLANIAFYQEPTETCLLASPPARLRCGRPPSYSFPI